MEKREMHRKFYYGKVVGVPSVLMQI